MKKYVDVSKRLPLIAPGLIKPITKVKRDVLGEKKTALDLGEVLIALSVSIPTNTTIEEIMNNIHILNGCEAHSTVMLDESEMQTLRKLGIRMTCEPEYDA